MHLSDLHFGRDRPELLDPLVDCVNALSPDLVAISGDLTQRALAAQFHAARAFLDRLVPPVLVVPGNHDVPLYNPLMRWFLPFHQYRRWIDRDLEPVHRDDEMTVIGLNTVNPYSWQRGRVHRHALARACDAFADAKGYRVIVAHHPMEQEPGDHKKPMRGAERAIDQLSDCGADVILTGHLHNWRVGTFAARAGRNSAVQVHAGTGLSTRLRGEPNDFNLLELEPGRITITRHVAVESGTAFEPAEIRRYTADGAGGWTR